MSILPAREKNALIKDINKIIQDTSINTVIKYRQFKGEDYYNPEEQVFSEYGTYTDWSGVSALRGIVGIDETRYFNENELADTKFIFMQSSVSNPLTTADLVVESGVTYDVTKITYDNLGLIYTCYGKKK